MTIGMVIGLILLPFVWAMMAATNKAHREETGVDAPTRNAWRNIRRNARRKGISEEQAYREWLERKQRRRPPALPPPLPDFAYSAAPQRQKATPTALELAQDEADVPLREYAAARRLRLHRQSDGLYYLLNFGDAPGTMVRNPSDPTSYDFSREQVIRYLGQLPESGSSAAPLSTGKAPR